MRASDVIRIRRTLSAVLAAWAVGGLLATDVAATCGNLGCTQPTCTISSVVMVDDGCAVDWSGKNVTITRTGKLQTAVNGQSFSIDADQLAVEGTLQAQGGTLAVNISARGGGDGSLTMRSVSNSPGKIDVRNGGAFKVTATGAIHVDGQDVNADGGTAGGGGTVSLSGGSVSVTGPIHADGTTGGDGGYVELVAGGAVAVDASVTANAQGSSSTGNPQSGGGIYLYAGGTLSITKALQVKGDQNGDGGFIDLGALGAATLSANYTANGVGTSTTGAGDGGSITLQASSATVNGAWSAVGNATGQGGSITILTTSGSLTTTSLGSLNVSTGAQGGVGGDVSIIGATSVSLGSSITADAGGTGSEGGTITVKAGGTLGVAQAVEAISTSTNGASDGSISLSGCSVSIAGTVKTRKPLAYGTNVVRYSTGLTIAASVLADTSQGNTFYCACPDAAPSDGVCDSQTCVSNPVINSGTINPAQTVIPVVMPPCS